MMRGPNLFAALAWMWACGAVSASAILIVATSGHVFVALVFGVVGLLSGLVSVGFVRAALGGNV